MRRFYPESNISGMSHQDGLVAFFSQVLAVVKPTDRVLDFGAGRGESLFDDPVAYRRGISNLHGKCAHLEGCDVDKVVLENPFLDHAEVIELGATLPYPDNHFDVIVARAVFEHLDDPEPLARELLRVVKPGGLIAATTPNKFGYIAIAAQLIPNRHHVSVLRKVQPTRKAEDVFPTRYRLNTKRALRKAFGHGADVHVAFFASEPAYHFGSTIIFRMLRWLNKHLPNPMLPTLHIYITKR